MADAPGRRQFLSLIGTAGLTGIAGCSRQTEPPRTGGESTGSDSPSSPPAPTHRNTDTRTSTPETERPVIEAYDVSATSRAGELVAELEASDNAGLGSAVIRTSVDEVERVLDGQQDSLNTRIKGSPGKDEQIHVLLKDETGNQTTELAESYVRKYDVMENTRLSLCIEYISDFPFRPHCWNDREPAIGQFDEKYPSWVFERHLDQFSGFGIGRVMVQYAGDEDAARQAKRFLDSELIDTVTVEPRYSISKWFWSEDATEENDDLRKDVLKPHMTWIRDNILSQDNVSTYEGRPILQIWAAGQLTARYTHDRIMDEWGSYEIFVDDMRSLLRTDGKDPFVVASTGWYGYDGYRGERKPAMAKQFDAVGSFLAGYAWRLNEPDNFATQETALDFVKQNFQGHREFVAKHDMEFIPMAFPGFNERGCPEARPEGRKTPRSPEFLRKTLELSDEYRTTDLINLAPVNWLEGTQITPGTFKGNDYRTEYLEVVREFQQGENG